MDREQRTADIIRQYYQYSNIFDKTNYLSQNITNNYLNSNLIDSQKGNDNNKIINDNNNYNASKNMNSSLMNSKKSKISNNNKQKKK